jgi:hypothetical protein
MKINVLSQNGFLFNRVKDMADRIFWKCALNSSHKCNAVFTTNKFLRVLNNQSNHHNHDKKAYSSIKQENQRGKRN